MILSRTRKFPEFNSLINQDPSPDDTQLSINGKLGIEGS
jgi:hypothetical protein